MITRELSGDRGMESGKIPWEKGKMPEEVMLAR
jgi:hypothetical protein